MLVHVGAHKTGSSSIQKFLQHHSDQLAGNGVAVYQGKYRPDKHVELHVAAMRPERISPFKAATNISGGADFAKKTEDRLQIFAARVQQPCLVFSSEGLSYLRYDDEFLRLKSILPKGKVEIVFYIREPAAFLRSYRRQAQTFKPSVNVSDEEWLVDFDRRAALFREHFGSVSVVDYDKEVQTVGNVIPSFLKILGVFSIFQTSDWQNMFENVTGSPGS